LPTARVVAGIVFLLGGIALGVATWRRERAVMIGWLWFLGMLVPVIGLVQVGRQSMANRYTYLPHIGLLIAIVWGVTALLEKWGATALRAGAVASAVAVAALAARTFHQLGYWHDSGTLFAHAMKVTDRNPVAHANLATHLLEHGDSDRALQLFIRATEIVPREPGPYYHAARLFAERGQHDEAVRYFRESIAREPDSFVAHYDLAVEVAEHGKVTDALPHFEQAIRIKPEQPEAHYAYSLALRQAGENERADSAYQRYVEIARRRGVEPLPIPATNPDNRSR
jgi:protein O-mannosyl-transferase